MTHWMCGWSMWAGGVRVSVLATLDHVLPPPQGTVVFRRVVIFRFYAYRSTSRHRFQNCWPSFVFVEEIYVWQLGARLFVLDFSDPCRNILKSTSNFPMPCPVCTHTWWIDPEREAMLALLLGGSFINLSVFIKFYTPYVKWLHSLSHLWGVKFSVCFQMHPPPLLGGKFRFGGQKFQVS
jgi:hypothetical protein